MIRMAIKTFTVGEVTRFSCEEYNVSDIVRNFDQFDKFIMNEVPVDFVIDSKFEASDIVEKINVDIGKVVSCYEALQKDKMNRIELPFSKIDSTIYIKELFADDININFVFFLCDLLKIKKATSSDIKNTYATLISKQEDVFIKISILFSFAVYSIRVLKESFLFICELREMHSQLENKQTALIAFRENLIRLFPMAVIEEILFKTVEIDAMLLTGNLFVHLYYKFSNSVVYLFTSKQKLEIKPNNEKMFKFISIMNKDLIYKANEFKFESSLQFKENYINLFTSPSRTTPKTSPIKRSRN